MRISALTDTKNGSNTMESIYKEINTEVGYIEAKRDAIYLDSFQQENNILILLGEVYAKWCEKKLSQYKWYKYRLAIKGVKEYNAVNIEDFYKKKINTPSSFSEVLDISNDNPNLRTIIIETYDWVYIVTCKNFESEVIGYR